MDAERRRAQLMGAALLIVQRDGMLALDTRSLAREANCSPDLVRHYLGKTKMLRDAVIDFAKRKKLRVVVDEAKTLGLG